MSDQGAGVSVGAQTTHAPPDDPGGSASVLGPAGVDEGRALDRGAERTPELTPVALGDDVTDEDAFRASTARGGTAVLVADAPRETAASHGLRDPEAVVGFLVTLAHAEN